jgi:hypothetical protein
MNRPEPPGRAASDGGWRSPSPGGRHNRGPDEPTPPETDGLADDAARAGRVLAAAVAYARAHTEAAIRDAVVVGEVLARDDGRESWMVRVETAARTLMFLKVYLAPDGDLEVRHYRL